MARLARGFRSGATPLRLSIYLGEGAFAGVGSLSMPATRSAASSESATIASRTAFAAVKETAFWSRTSRASAGVSGDLDALP